MSYVRAIGLGAAGDPSALQVMNLQAQINRFFDASAPKSLRLLGDALPVTGVLDSVTAARATALALLRLDMQETSPAEQAQENELMANNSSIPYIGANIDALTQLFANVAAANGIKPAKDLPGGFGGGSTTTYLLVGVAALVGIALYMKGHTS